MRQGLAAWGHESETADGAGDWGALWAPPGSVFEITSAMGQAKPLCVLTYTHMLISFCCECCTHTVAHLSHVRAPCSKGLSSSSMCMCSGHQCIVQPPWAVGFNKRDPFLPSLSPLVTVLLAPNPGLYTGQPAASAPSLIHSVTLQSRAGSNHGSKLTVPGGTERGRSGPAGRGEAALTARWAHAPLGTSAAPIAAAVGSTGARGELDSLTPW